MITVRPYRAEDRAVCLTVFYRAVREGAASFYDAVQREAWAPTPKPDLTKADKLLDQSAWVSEEAGQITGFMSLTTEGHLDMAFVLPEVMGKGHAAALYDRLQDHARAKGFAKLTVHASEYSRRFLARRGWTLNQTEPVTSDSGVVWIRNVMSLDLAAALDRQGSEV